MTRTRKQGAPENANLSGEAGRKTVPIKNVRIAGYTLLREIGRGGMSIVYLAEQDSLKREVAIKVLKKNVANDPEVANRFLHEAKIIAKLDHPNIVSIFEVGHTADGDPYYSMPYLRFGDLSQAEFKFDKDIKHLMYGVCEGLAYSHEHDVIHRDLKPANILFDHFGNAQVADFGIALSRNSKRWTKQEHIIGSACYMSPEQALSKPVTQASDLYSLGTILYEQLTGSPPFEKDDDLSTLVAHINEPIPRLPPEKAHWQGIIDKALAKHPEDRFFNALEFKNAVQQVSPGYARAFSQAFSRHPKGAIAAILTTAAALLWFLWPFDYHGQSANTTVPAVSTPPATLTQHEDNGAEIQPRTATKPPELDQLELSESTLDKTTLPETAKETSSDTLPAPETTSTEENTAKPPTARDILSAQGQGAEGLTPAQAITLISAGFQKIKEKRLTRPAGNNALAYFTEVLRNYPNNKRATQGVQLIFNYFLEQIRQALQAGNLTEARRYAEKLQALYNQTGLHSSSKTLAAEIIHSAEQRMNTLRKTHQADAAETLAALVALALPDQHEALAALQASAAAIPRPGDHLPDSQGLETIFVSADPARHVAAFGLMPHEVTVAEYARFAKATGRKPARCQHKAVFKPFASKTWRKPPFKQTPQHAVICVSWADANAFAKWISDQSGNTYRLPTEKQWRSLARWKTAGSTPCQKGNVAGQETKGLHINSQPEKQPWKCRDQFVFTAPVTGFSHNSLGISDIWGNSAEWLAGCSQKKAPNTKNWLKKISSPKGDRCQRIYAGNSWLDGTGIDAMSFRSSSEQKAYTHVGFRLVRDLNPD